MLYAFKAIMNHMTALIDDPGLEQYMVRGLQNRKSNSKEQLQMGVIRAFASAAGCNIQEPVIDEGIDVVLTHQIQGIQDRLAINFQLKCTEKEVKKDGKLTVRLSCQRYDEMRSCGKSEPTILVAQHVVPKIDDWISIGDNHTKIHVKNYWLNLTGMEERKASSAKAKIDVSVPTKNIFDDATIILLFAQLRKGILER